MRKWCKKIGIEIFDKWLISLDRVTYDFNENPILRVQNIHFSNSQCHLFRGYVISWIYRPHEISEIIYLKIKWFNSIISMIAIAYHFILPCFVCVIYQQFIFPDGLHSLRFQVVIIVISLIWFHKIWSPSAHQYFAVVIVEPFVFILYVYICDMIKRNESDVGHIVFEILAKTAFKFLCFILFLAFTKILHNFVTIYIQ